MRNGGDSHVHGGHMMMQEVDGGQGYHQQDLQLGDGVLCDPPTMQQPSNQPFWTRHIDN